MSPTDPLKDEYRQAIVEDPRRQVHLANQNVALLCIDLQYLDAAKGHGLFAHPDNSGVSAAGQTYYFDRLERTALPNVKALQDTFRAHDLEVIHCRICALTNDGRDRSAGHKRLHLLARPDSKDAEILEEVAPEGDEIVISKTASGVFTSTNLHYVLGNLGVRLVYVVGVYTNECVETTVRDACDLGYWVTLIEDGCSTVTEELHQASLATLRDRYARVTDTQTIIREIEATFGKTAPGEERSKGISGVAHTSASTTETVNALKTVE